MDFIPVIEQLLSEKTCIVGMGNDLMLDDGVGPYIVDELIGHIKPGRITVLNVGDVPENYVCKIAGSDSENVIIIDAVNTGEETGSFVFSKLNEFNEMNNNYSTHKLSLFLCAKMLEEYKKKVFLLGINVRDTDFGTGLSVNVKKSADLICDLLIASINRDQKEQVYEH